MVKSLNNEKEVKRMLNIDSFRNLSKDKIMYFVSEIPKMDKEVAMNIVNQFPNFAGSAVNMITRLKELSESAIKESSESQKGTLQAYRNMLEDLGEVIKKDNISQEERTYILEKMQHIADQIHTKDSEQKQFHNGIINRQSSLVAGALVLGAAILGVNIRKK